MQIKTFFKNFEKYKTKTLASLLIALGFLSYFETKIFERRKIEKEQNLINAYSRKANMVFLFNEKKQKEAKIQISFYAKKSKENLLKAYNYDVDALYTDLKLIKNKKNNNLLPAIIISNTISGVTLNKVPLNRQDSNDIFVILLDLIVSDLSKDCSIEGKEIRTLLEEAQRHSAPILAKNALLQITKYGKTYSFWHYSPFTTHYPWNSEISKFENPDIDYLKEKFISHKADLNYLKGFEFLVASRVNENTDIAFNPVLKPNGSVNKDSLQLIFVQGYNLVDQINIDLAFKYELSQVDAEIKNFNSQLIDENFYKDLTLVVIFLAFFFLSVVLYNEKK